jgi:LacI family transcriptional regulator
VLINSQYAGENFLSLGVANYEGARAMMAHLIARGYRRIAFIAGPEDNFDAYQRLRGYQDAMAELGVEEWVLPGAFDEASGHRAGRAVLVAKDRPEAVFAANDMMALGCLFAFSQAGVRVPDEIAVAGFDDIPLARFVYPGLTTMQVDISGLGASAARMLLARLSKQTPLPAPTPLLPQLVVRESSGRQSGSDSS